MERNNSDGRVSSSNCNSYSRVYDEDLKGHARDVTLTSYVGGVVASIRAGHQHRVATYGPLDWAALFLPCISWLRRYKVREYLLRDVVAGLSIGAMIVPQGMSYALLAGLPPQYGLYGAFVPVLVYAVFGSSPQLAVGPVAVTSLLLSTGLHKIVPEVEASGVTDPSKLKTPEQEAAQQLYNDTAIQVALLVSIAYTAIGVMQLGFLANFLSHSVISGFTTGAAIVIGMSQLKYFFGVKMANPSTLHETVDALADAIQTHGVNWREMLMFAAWLALLLAVKQVAKTWTRLSWLRPTGPITVALLSIALVAAFDLQNHGIRIVQHIPAGLPPYTGTVWGPLFRGETRLGKQLSLAAIVLLIDFLESISIATMLARRGKYEIRVTQEIVGLGIANFFGSMFSAYTTTGSFCRSAVSADVGSRTGLFGMVTGLLVMFVLLVLTPIFEKVPYNAMGAIVVSACFGLFQAQEALFLYRANFLDFTVWLAAFFGTIFAGVELGLAIAIGLALLLVIYQSAYPHTAALGRLPGTDVYRSIAQYPHATQHKGIVIMRIDAPIYFANVQWIRTKLHRYLQEARMEAMLCPIRFLILDLSPVPFIDATGMHALLDLCTSLQEEGLQLVLANPCANVKEQLARVHVLEAVGKEWVFVGTADAVDACIQAILESGDMIKADYREAFAVTESKQARSRDSTGTVNWPGLAQDCVESAR